MASMSTMSRGFFSSAPFLVSAIFSSSTSSPDDEESTSPNLSVLFLRMASGSSRFLFTVLLGALPLGRDMGVWRRAVQYFISRLIPCQKCLEPKKSTMNSQLLKATFSEEQMVCKLLDSYLLKENGLNGFFCSAEHAQVDRKRLSIAGNFLANNSGWALCLGRRFD